MALKIIRYAPDMDIILKEIAEYYKQDDFKDTPKNLSSYFERKTSKGCLMLEKENGPDPYIDDLRQDIFERFNRVREMLYI